MSEPTAESLVRRIRVGVRTSNVIPTPIDPTLSNQGEAADAAATGAAIAGVIGNLRVNGKGPTNNAITVLAGDIPMSAEAGAASIAEAIEDVQNKNAANIMYDTDENVSIKAALDNIFDTLDSEMTESEIDDVFDSVFGGEE